MGGSSPTTAAVGCGGASNGGGSSGSFCDMGVGCWCGWRCRENQHGGHHRFFSSAFVFFLGCFVLLGSVATLYAGLAFTPTFRNPLAGSGSSSLGCQEDNEGSWSVGVFYGESPFSLKPIEAMNVWKDGSAAWPVANPVLTCASVSDAGFPSNFVADPFLYAQGDTLYLFYETKNSITLQGDIGVTKSTDKGVTWQQVGIALDEDWHLSYPYVFDYLGEVKL